MTTWTVTCQALLSMEFSRQKYWSGFPSSTPWALPDPEMEHESLSLLCWQVDALPLFHLVVIVVQSLGHGRLFSTPWTAARQAPLSFPVSQRLLKLMSIESVMPCMTKQTTTKTIDNPMAHHRQGLQRKRDTIYIIYP